jgi:hypothetical protein
VEGVSPQSGAPSSLFVLSRPLEIEYTANLPAVFDPPSYAAGRFSP